MNYEVNCGLIWCMNGANCGAFKDGRGLYVVLLNLQEIINTTEYQTNLIIQSSFKQALHLKFW